MVTMLLLDYQANSWNEICTLYHFVIWFSFLVSYSMQVRLMVGLLKSVGTGDLTTADVERILNAKTVTVAPPMAPACGLYLANVKYDLSV